MSENESESEKEREGPRAEHVRAVRIGHGANCSSVGSVIDTLFLGAAVGGAVFAAVLAAMKVEDVTVVGARETETEADANEEEEKAP